MIKLIALGRLGGDARLITENVAKPFLSFSLAIDNGKDQQGNERPATWLKCTYQVKDGTTLVEFMKKGQIVYIEGRPDIDVYQVENENRTSQLVYVYTLELAGK